MKTALQEFVDELYKRNPDEAWSYMSQVWPTFVEKEKKQILNAWEQGENVGTRNQSGWDESYKTTPMNKEDYYNQTFPKTK